MCENGRVRHLEALLGASAATAEATKLRTSGISAAASTTTTLPSEPGHLPASAAVRVPARRARMRSESLSGQNGGESIAATSRLTRDALQRCTRAADYKHNHKRPRAARLLATLWRRPRAARLSHSPPCSASHGRAPPARRAAQGRQARQEDSQAAGGRKLNHTAEAASGRRCGSDSHAMTAAAFR
jgi:hypothetical protein